MLARKCPCCGVTYGLDEEFYDYRKRGGTIDGRQAAWYCPNGHRLVMTESDAERLQREVDRLKQREAMHLADIKAADKRITALKGELTKTKKRVGHGVCPCCNRSFANLRRHMATKHADYNVVPLRKGD